MRGRGGFYLVWKLFCIIFFGTPAAILSSSSISFWSSFQPSDPMFSWACLRFLAPGMGMVFLQMHQLIAICERVLFLLLAISVMVLSRGCIPGSIWENARLRIPLGRGVFGVYLPVSSPRARGL